MAKRLREDEPSQVVTCEERSAKRQASGAGGVAENLQHGLPLGWDPSAPVKQPLAGPPAAHTLLPGGEPLRPVNQQTGHGAAAAAGGQHPPQHQQQHHDPQQQHPPELPLDAAELAAAAAAAGCGDIDWRSPEQVAHLLRILHMERLRRLGQQLPPAYRG